MKTRFLFPRQWRIVGYICLILWMPFMVIKKLAYHGYMKNGNPIKIYDDNGLFSIDHFYSAMPLLILIIGLIFIAFAKEKIEDEQIAQLRLDSLQWSIYFSYFIFMLAIILVNATDLTHNIGLCMWIPIVFFIIRFRWKIFQLNNLFNKHEESVYKS